MFDHINMQVIHHAKEDKIKTYFLLHEQSQPRFLTTDDLNEINPDYHLTNLPLLVATENLTLGNVSSRNTFNNDENMYFHCLMKEFSFGLLINRYYRLYFGFKAILSVQN